MGDKEEVLVWFEGEEDVVVEVMGIEFICSEGEEEGKLNVVELEKGLV